jgi:hypothetical protein
MAIKAQPPDHDQVSSHAIHGLSSRQLNGA